MTNFKKLKEEHQEMKNLIKNLINEKDEKEIIKRVRGLKNV